ncbi:MAG: hypothetical protein AAF682_14480 [Planctomycetota bacterium]
MLTPLALALLPSQVWIVDDSGGPGVDFTDLPPAIAAASAGDVLIVRAGSYSEAVVGQGITIQADEGALADAAGLRIESVPAGESVHIAGLTVPSIAWLSDCDGKVWIEDCSFTPPGEVVGEAEAAVTIHDCADVVLVDTTGIGSSLGLMPSLQARTSPGLAITQSSVHTFGCSFEGGRGTWIESVFGAINAQPSPGAAHESGELIALASLFTGGQGHASQDPSTLFCERAPGAAGVTALAPLYVRDSSLVGGHGGVGGLFSTCPEGEQGPPFSGDAPVELAGEYVALEVASPVIENGTFDLTVSGTPGVLAVVGITTAQDAILVPAWGGSLVLQGSPVVLSPVVIPPAGTLTQTLPLSDLGPGVETLSFYGQVAAVDPVGAFTINDATAIVLLDEQF